jgi:hypothetical protein
MALTTGKAVEVLFEKAFETYESQDMLLPLCDLYTPDAAMMQNSGDIIWRTVEQHADYFTGWDATGRESDIIEETYPATLGEPGNDFPQARIDKMRDLTFWERRGETSGRKQASVLNKTIAETVAQQGSLFYRTNATSGFTAIAQAQALMNERQLNMSTRCVVLNDRDTLTYAEDLAARQTVQGQPAATWKNGQIANNVAEFDVYTGSFLPNLTGGAAISATVTGDQSFKPEGGTVSQAAGSTTNVDYRLATLACSDSDSYSIGDKVEIHNNGTAVTALGLDDKTDTGQAMTFTVVAKPTTTSITVYPKPIAYDDATLTNIEKQYANIDTVILDTATIERVNTDATNKTNLFWDKSAVEVIGGTLPADLLAQFAGKKVVNRSLSNGLEMYMVYDGDIRTLQFTCRIFTWWNVIMANPSNAGCFVTY